MGIDKERLVPLLGEDVVSFSAVGGGSIAVGGRITTASGRTLFLKTGVAGEMLRCEADGLRELSEAGVLRIPAVIAVTDEFLITEYIRQGPVPPGFFSDFGRRLAMMHRYCGRQYGFYEDNYIGSTPQLNIPQGNQARDWTEFWFDKRLLYQYRLAESNGYATAGLRSGFVRLESRIAPLLRGSEERPSLLHGDLWSGNYLCDEQGNAVIIDPAVYYGHREADLAMTSLFGSFPSDFYDAYEREYPLPTGWRRRQDIYKLYHVLNHLNIFGRSYLREAERILDKL